MSNPRETQFQGFAKLLLDELKPDLSMLLVLVSRRDEQGIEAHEHIIQSIIAQRAYDLASHVVESCMDQESNCQYDSQHLDRDMLQHVPDLTTWTNEGETNAH